MLLAALVPADAGGDPGRARPLLLPQLVGFTLLAGRMQVLSSWLVPAWWLLLPLAGDWLERKRGRLTHGLPRTLATATLLTIPALLAMGTAQVRWGVLDRWLPAGLDTSAELMPAETLRRTLRLHPQLWRALREAYVIASNRYDLPGFLALALGSSTAASYTTFGSDARGFAWWQASDGFAGARGSGGGPDRAAAGRVRCFEYTRGDPPVRIPKKV